MSAARHIPLLPVEELARRERRQSSSWPQFWDALDTVKDPEIPVVSIWELGILQDVDLADGILRITITPTYSGCPAMTTIAEDIENCLADSGYPVSIETRLAPAWSTSWISESARAALRDYGIAPPREAGEPVTCPRCGSSGVRKLSQFGSTACKALFQCGDCREPFDHFKPF